MTRRLLAPILLALALVFVFATAAPASASTLYHSAGSCSGWSTENYAGGAGRPHVAWSVGNPGCTSVQVKVLFTSGATKTLYGPGSFSWYGNFGQTIYYVTWRICAGSVCTQWTQRV